jgi:hypothetical protein
MSGQIRVPEFVLERLRRSCYPPERPRQVLAQELPDALLGPASLQRSLARLQARRKSGVRNEAGQVVETTDSAIADAPDLGATMTESQVIQSGDAGGSAEF